MSMYIVVVFGQIVFIVLFFGDLLWVKWIVEMFFDDVELYSQMCGMLGFIGIWEGYCVFVQGLGMGQFFMVIYVNELFIEYDVQIIVCVGLCGVLIEWVKICDIIIVNGVSIDLGINWVCFYGFDFVFVVDFLLLWVVVEVSEFEIFELIVYVGQLFLSDQFYSICFEFMEFFVWYGIFGVEMEVVGFYMFVVFYGCCVFVICMVSDYIVIGEEIIVQECEQMFGDMICIVLCVVIF